MQQIDPNEILRLEDPLLREMAFLMWLKSQGYLHPKPVTGGRWAAISEKMFTIAINTGEMMDFHTVNEHWCYSAGDKATKMESYVLAKAAFDAWDGNGEPSGWIRHPASGRRRRDGEVIYAP